MPASPFPLVDLDLRLVQCFMVLAEHRHFGRAAEALHTTQPSLTRQIHRLEQQLGVRLLDRSAQRTQLTEAGKVFLPLAESLVGAATQAMACTRAAGRTGRITIGYTTGLTVTPAVRELRHRHPDADVRTLHLAWNAPRTALLQRRVDAVVARSPFSTERLHVTQLYDEPRVLVVSVEHRLAGKEYVTIEDIADEPMPRVQQSDPLWSAFWRIDPRPDGRPAPDGPLVEAVEDKFEAIATGRAVGVSAGVHAHNLRPDLTTVPLVGVEPSHVVLATRADDQNGLVAAFRRYAKAHLTGPRQAEPE
ncbi:LysR substrate-binding domain-containing protein [Amycolatopsis pithecellobii]|uniref:LysR family transcriptional regulator n=1 Tax=Amycolatopsis pithecellobii TaxID=664692 RepID=A0A6N7YU81_9PSEU|nr:LysR family transcriptional regulator [Amycolatopsis pithecellobii]MTD56617.1 LysR family transcriptional regulator [Amycolatopsis pithecellobii]